MNSMVRRLIEAALGLGGGFLYYSATRVGDGKWLKDKEPEDEEESKESESSEETDETHFCEEDIEIEDGKEDEEG